MNNLYETNHQSLEQFELWQKLAHIYETDTYEKLFNVLKQAHFTEEEIDQLLFDLFKLTFYRKEL